ncbi:MAG: hypothetical protein L0338_32525 [Acidobacteria bacterium]|nr:hypothetical protein [Acidobacteriota bacterium]
MNNENAEKVSSEEYKEISTLLAQKIVELVRSATEKGLQLPLELHVTGADDDIVAQALIHDDGTGRPKLDRLNIDQPLTAVFPVTATLKDKNGECLEITFTRASLQ